MKHYLIFLFFLVLRPVLITGKIYSQGLFA